MKNDGHTGNEDADGLDARGDAALWDLLGRAAAPKAGPYFARRVLREVSLHEEARTAARWWHPAALWRAFRRSGRVAFLAGTPVAALLLVFAGMQLNAPGRRRQTPVAASVAAPAAVPAAVAPNGRDVPAASPAASVPAAASPDEVSEQDVEVIADLDTMLKSEQNRLWTEDTARF